MIKCKLINPKGPNHLYIPTMGKERALHTALYYKEKLEQGKDIWAFQNCPIIVPDKDYVDLIILSISVPGISPDAGSGLSMKYDMLESFLKDWEILGVYEYGQEQEDLEFTDDDVIDMEEKSTALIADKEQEE